LWGGPGSARRSIGLARADLERDLRKSFDFPETSMPR
jgi:hypothetical protein